MFVPQALLAYTRGGSVSRWKCRCLAIAATNRSNVSASSVTPAMTPGSALAGGKRRAYPAGLQQTVRTVQSQQRLAVPILILQELECASVPLENRDGRFTARQDDGVVENRGSGFQADVHLDWLAGA